ncbi:uncharacterized protein Dwil_GK13354 [Drosophila willistoni]|uniref:Uncharacterized protein n=1 Tax=Drosophila willistoni TaxID=7260 RepID=B4NKC4_DROWI|nr:uncharacterized protein Dwil_GK13354 [Drosophila willistoni]
MSSDEKTYHEDELVAPTWLNAQFLEQVLSSYEADDQVKVRSVNISPATLKGDHYASIMFRANVKYTNKKGDNTKSLIIKTMPEVEGFKKDQLSESHIFKTEIGMYSEMLPEVERILRAAGDDTKLCAECIYYSLEPNQVIIFEDLVVRDYTVLRDREPTISDTKLALSKVAKLHAITYKLLKDV